MRSTIAFAIVALVLCVFGFAFIGVARLDGYLADAGQRLSTLQYGAAAYGRPSVILQGRLIRVGVDVTW